MMFSIIFCIWTLREFQWRDVTSFDSVTVIHCRNHWHHHWRRRIHRCRASIGASGCMEGKVSKGVLNLPNGCFFYGFLRGNLYHGYPKNCQYHLDIFVIFGIIEGETPNEGEWGISQFSFFHFEGTFISWIPKIVIKFFFFVTCVPLNMDALFLQTFPTGTCAPLFSICAFLCRRH